MRTHRVARLVAILLFLAALVYFCGGMAVGLSLWSRGLGEGWGSGFSGWLAIPILAGTLFGAITLLMFGAILYFLARIDANLAAARQNLPVSAAQQVGAGAVVTGAVVATEAAPVVPPEAAPVPAEPIVVGTAAAATGAAPREEAPPPATEAGAIPSPGPAGAGLGAAATAAVAGAAVAGVAVVAAHKDEAGPIEVGTVATTASAIPQVEIGPLETPEAKGAPAKMLPPDLQDELPADADAEPQEFAGKLPGIDEAARIASEMSGSGEPDKPETEN